MDIAIEADVHARALVVLIVTPKTYNPIRQNLLLSFWT